MKVLPSRNVQTEGEAHVEKIVSKMGHNWRDAGKEAIGLDGFIEVVRQQNLSGQIIGIQIKSGRSYLVNRRKQKDEAHRLRLRHRRINIEEHHLSYYRQCKFPVVIVWYDPTSENAFWGLVDESSSSSFPIPNVFDRFAGRQIARVADEWHSVFPKLDDPRTPRVSINTVKRKAFEFYRRCRESECLSPAFGRVHFTLRGWRHITAQNKDRSRILRSLELLGAAKAIIMSQEHFHVCRVTPRGHVLFKQTARIRHPNRADAIVSVITERIGNGPHQFLSVYEQRKKGKGGR
jgi:hypothetical protein